MKKVTCITTWNDEYYYLVDGEFVNGNDNMYGADDYELVDIDRATELATEQGFELFKVEVIELELV